MGNGLKMGNTLQTRDVNSKVIFGDKLLMAQFLRGYSGLEEFKNVQPEQIEAVPLRYYLLEGVEMNADTAVRVWQFNQKYSTRKGKKRKRFMPIYIISLVDHKSNVDYNAGMQILRYMVCLWQNWEKEMEKKGFDCKSKDFRYPLIYPIVYYEGSEEWTASRNLRSRIYDGKSLPEYVPDFAYHVVRLHDYSDAELMEHKDEMSLLMTFNKAQDGDFSEFKNLDAAEVDGILKDTPEHVLDIVVGTARSLLHKLNTPEEEAEEYLGKLRKDRKVGYLFENMKKMDIQEERRKTAEQRQRTEEQRRRAEEAERRAEKAEQDREKAERDKEKAEREKKDTEEKVFQVCVEMIQETRNSRDAAKKKLMETFSLNEAEAEKKVRSYWK